MHMMESIAFIAFLAIFVILLLMVFSGAGKQTRAAKPKGVPRQVEVGQRSLAARQATQRAGYAGGPAFVNVMDIGLLAYQGLDEPRLVRTGKVLSDTDYLRPFAELWLPHEARGTIRFELADAGGRLRYADEARYDLGTGRNTLLPGTWLPLRDKRNQPGEWTLRLSAGDLLLAAHRFGWQPVGGGELQRYMASDGEISPELQRALDAQPLEAISLSDLLSRER